MDRRVGFLMLMLSTLGCARGPALMPASGVGSERVVTSLRPAVEVSGRPPVRWTLAERMSHHGVPGVSIAVADKGRIVWARGFGVQTAGTADSVTPETLFQAASISKVVAATATLRLADQGVLDLDADVNRYLSTWKVRENRFTEREKATLRRILSHSAGLTVHGFNGYRGSDTVPSLLQVLDGRPPARNDPVRVDTFPGTITRYSGGGTTVQQLLLTEVVGKPFPQLMKELVLSPTGMRNSTFEQPLPDSIRSRAARGHTAEGTVIRGGYALGPEMAAGWLWSTPTDLLRWATAIDQAYDGKDGAILSRKMAEQMLTLQSESYGLGPLLEGSGRSLRFSHGGNNPGYRAQLTFFPETGQGLAVMVNGAGGDLLIDEIIRSVASEYTWPALAPLRLTPTTLDDAALARVLGEYRLLLPGATTPIAAKMTRESGRIGFNAPPVMEGDELIPVSATEFVSLAWGYRMEIDLGTQGRATGFTITYGNTVMSATRDP